MGIKRVHGMDAAGTRPRWWRHDSVPLVSCCISRRLLPSTWLSWQHLVLSTASLSVVCLHWVLRGLNNFPFSVCTKSGENALDINEEHHHLPLHHKRDGTPLQTEKTISPYSWRYLRCCLQLWPRHRQIYPRPLPHSQWILLHLAITHVQDYPSKCTTRRNRCCITMFEQHSMGQPPHRLRILHLHHGKSSCY